MKVAIDAFPAMLPKSGIGNYTRHLSAELVRLSPDDDYYFCDIMAGSFFSNIIKLKKDFSNAEDFLKVSNVGFPFITLARMLLSAKNKLLRRTTNLSSIDIFHGTNYRGIFGDSFRTVVTIHDMAHEYFPETHQERTLHYFRNEFIDTVAKAHMLIADSEMTKRDVVRFLSVAPEKIRVVYLGVDEQFRVIADTQHLSEVHQRYALPEKFILFVGTLQPRKNLSGLLKAYAQLRSAGAIPQQLVLAGSVGWKNEGLKQLIYDLNLEDTVHCTGFIADDDLPALYNLADVFVMPSLYEGFGLPVVEAMACGTPVLTANTSCLPEIAGDAAVLVDPNSINEIAAGIGRLLADRDLRQSCRDKGLERAALFTWEKCARETLAVFQEVMASR